MPTKRRVILSGTPIQNDLQEFYYVMDVVNPGVMGNLTAFKRIYEKPILQSKERNCKDFQKQEGDARAEELKRKCNMFILRRTSKILIQYLPPKIEQIIFCRLSDVQIKLYSFFLKSRNFQEDLMESMSYAFGCITLMSKLCNHPALIYEKIKSNFPEALRLFGDNFNPDKCQPEYSGKIEAIDRILSNVKQENNNSKVVLVSNYTKTLDVLEKFCRDKKYLFLRLDGSTDSSKRMKLVERFNNKFSPEFIFLLSSKAGGVGLNLIGGNRLILLDPDWNPATDEQAMARVWREGQPKPVFIYRMFSTGTIEEKIYQRQMRKQAISRSIVDESISEKRNFTNDELKRLFELNIDTCSDTHDLIACSCLGKLNSSKKSNDDLAGITFSADDGWHHYDCIDTCEDPAISKIDNSLDSTIYSDDHKSLISFIFAHKTKDISDFTEIDDKNNSDDVDTAQYYGYDDDDFVSQNKKPKPVKSTKKKKKVTAKNVKDEKDESKDDVASSLPEESENDDEDDDNSFEIKSEKKVRKLSKSDASKILIDEVDDDMADLLEFSSEDEE